VVLTFVAAITGLGSMDGAPVDRVSLARSGATTAPEVIDAGQVLEHAVRHLAWLVAEDPVVEATLDDTWHRVLRPYSPEPFQRLG
jgi:hypothetical protein